MEFVLAVTFILVLLIVEVCMKLHDILSLYIPLRSSGNCIAMRVMISSVADFNV